MLGGGGIRRGLHIDDDDEDKPKYEHVSLEAGRKKDKFEKGLDDMLFGGAAPRRRKPAEVKEEPKPNTSQDKPKTEAIHKLADVIKQDNSISLQPSGGSASKTEVNRSSGINQGKAGVDRSGGAVVGKKQPSIMNPMNNSSQSNQNNSVREPGGTIGIISKPKIDNYVQPQAKQTEAGKQTEAPKQTQKQAAQKQAQPQPQQAEEEYITIDAVQGFGNKNKHNKPGFLRKGKKVAENFKFAEENVNLHTATDVVRPFETDRARQRKLNDFDFQDFEFPAKSVCLGTSFQGKESVWKKPNELAKVVNFGKYVDPNDLNPGSLSSSEFLSALSAISELQVNTKRLIEEQQANSNGFYLVRLFINSVWRYITVDSKLPFVDGENAGVISYEGDFDLQGALIEKAYAKAFGGYDVFERPQPREYYLRDLTGAPVRKYGVDHPDIKNIVSKALSSGQVVQAVPTEKISALGVNPNYSYSVINYSNKGVELRNSWGTLEERSKLSFRAEGNFDLSSVQVKENIKHILVTNLNTEYSTTTVQSRHRLGFYSTYSFKTRNQTHGYLTASQWDERLFPLSSGYEYSPATIILTKNNGDGTSEYVNANHSVNGRNLDLEVDLEAGSYTVYVAISWKQLDQSFNLSFYGSEKVDFSRIYTEKEPSQITQGLEALNLVEGKKTDPSKTSSQYFSYHKDSNCILITLENTASREGRVNLDLTRAKLDNLNLISGHSNDENYSEKVSYEIDDYKQRPLSDKRWSVHLEAGQRFTWVLAAREAFSEGNARAWGFN